MKKQILHGSYGVIDSKENNIIASVHAEVCVSLLFFDLYVSSLMFLFTSTGSLKSKEVEWLRESPTVCFKLTTPNRLKAKLITCFSSLDQYFTGRSNANI